MDEFLNLKEKKILYYFSILPLSIIAVSILSLILSILLGVFTCMIQPHKFFAKLAGLNIAVCSETVPMLVEYGLVIFLLIVFVLFIYILKRYSKNLEKKNILSRFYKIRIAIGIILFVLFLGLILLSILGEYGIFII